MIYFAQPTNGGPIRIGTAEDTRLRKKTLGTWLPGGIEFIAEIEGGLFGEAILLQCFSPIRIDGGKDWFRSCVEIWEFLVSLRNGKPEWIPSDEDAPASLKLASLEDEFGSVSEMAPTLGYSSPLMLMQAVNNQSLRGFNLRARVEFIRLLRAGALPSCISSLHGVERRAAA